MSNIKEYLQNIREIVTDNQKIWYDYLLEHGESFNVRKDSKCDHEGFYTNLKFLGMDIDINYYDVRHWDYDNECHEDGGDPESWSRI